jgi:hypothetical protein
MQILNLCSTHLEDAKPLLLGLFNLLLYLGLGQGSCFHSSWLLWLGILLTFAKHNSHRILCLNSMHLHKKAALGDIVEVVGAVLLRLLGLVLLVKGNDILPADKEVDGVHPEVRDGRDEILVRRVVGVVHEEGEDAESEEGTLVGVSLLWRALTIAGTSSSYMCRRTMVMKVCSSRLCQKKCSHDPSGAIMPG